MDQLTAWAMELQSIAQAGLQYGHDAFDRERYQRIREITAEMMAERTGLPVDKVTSLFCGDTGYQTPKVDTRAAVFRDGKILLVQERNGTWSLPGGWCEYNLSPADNTVRETLEEAGLNVRPVRCIAVQNRIRHNQPEYAWGVVKIFYQCELTGGEFTPNLETVASDWFDENALPPMAEEKNTPAQVALCFEASRAEVWETRFD
ncbi:MAG: NUDIX hydrolase [Clostridia bacterium]|nr:NUDIX hydrolase [Clostridia bacterium]